MENKRFWLRIHVMVLVFGITVVGVEAQSNNISLEGTTWVANDEDDFFLEFSSIPNMIGIDGGETSKGTYTISGNKITMTVFDETLTGTIYGNILSFMVDGKPYLFTRTNVGVEDQGNNASIFGTYISDNDYAMPISFTFNKDGTCYAGKPWNLVFDYKVNGKSVIISMQGVGVQFEINGNILTQTNNWYGGPWIKK